VKSVGGSYGSCEAKFSRKAEADSLSGACTRSIEETKMKFALIGAAAVAAAAFTTPAMAYPPVVSNPGYCAQFYPDANCQNLGPGNPYTDGNYRTYSWQRRHAAAGHVNHMRHVVR
jgi:hypothetical protein